MDETNKTRLNYRLQNKTKLYRLNYSKVYENRLRKTEGDWSRGK